MLLRFVKTVFRRIFPIFELVFHLAWDLLQSGNQPANKDRRFVMKLVIAYIQPDRLNPSPDGISGGVDDQSA